MLNTESPLERMPKIDEDGRGTLALAGLTAFAARGNEGFTPIHTPVEPITQSDAETTIGQIMID